MPEQSSKVFPLPCFFVPGKFYSRNSCLEQQLHWSHSLDCTADFIEQGTRQASSAFSRTCSYWSGVLFMEGCLLFLWPPLFLYHWPQANPRMVYYLAKIPLLLGTTLFCVGIYIGYFELINKAKDTSAKNINFLWCDWRELITRLQKDAGHKEYGTERHKVHWYQPVSSVAGGIIFLFGAFLFQVAQTCNMFDLPQGLEMYANAWLPFWGGALFAVGGLCQILHNRVWASTPSSCSWWTSVLNFVGGVGYWLCTCHNLVGAYSIHVGVVGTILFLLSAMLSIMVWHGKQFVCSASSTQIMMRSEYHNYQHVTAGLPWGGLLFVFLCVFYGIEQIIAFLEILATPSEFELRRTGGLQSVVNACFGRIANMLGIHLIIMLNSVSVHVPKQRRYRFLILCLQTWLTCSSFENILSGDLMSRDAVPYVALRQ